MHLDRSSFLESAARVDAPEFRPHRTFNPHNSPSKSSWRLLGDVVNKVIENAEREYLKGTSS